MRGRRPGTSHRLRIIGGRWRGRRLRFPDAPGLRPTPDRVRETLFNWLAPLIDGARCLDLFAGSGALGLEALSRGAGEVVFVERDRRVVQTLRENLKALGATAEVHQADALSWLAHKVPAPFDIVFLDPPFGQELLAPVCERLEQYGWLRPAARVYLEAEQDWKLQVLKNWTMLREKRAGHVAYRLVSWEKQVAMSANDIQGGDMFDGLKKKGFQILALHHAEAILTHDMADAVTELENVLLGISIPVEELIRSGGGEGELTKRLRRSLADDFGWKKHSFEIKKIVDGEEKESISHEVDHVKRFPTGTFALEIEWNNKDPFFDRDLENFKRLHADGVISVGAIITRGSTLQDFLRSAVVQFARKNDIDRLEVLSKYYTPTARQIQMINQMSRSKGSFEEGWAHAFVSDKFGEATTHWRKLEDRVRRGVGNPCPLLLMGIPKEVMVV